MKAVFCGISSRRIGQGLTRGIYQLLSVRNLFDPENRGVYQKGFRLKQSIFNLYDCPVMGFIIFVDTE
jgi:hypothetical protein